MNSPSKSSHEGDDPSLEQSVNNIFDRLSHLWDFTTTAYHRMAFRRLVTQTMTNMLNVYVFPLEGTATQRHAARQVATDFIDLYAQPIWPTFYNGTTHLLGADREREVWEILVEYVINLFRVDMIVQDLTPAEFDDALETLKRPTIYPRLVPRRAMSLPEPRNARNAHLYDRMLRRELLVLQRREDNTDDARIEASRQGYLRRGEPFDGCLSSDNDSLENDSVRETEQRSGADRCETDVEAEEDQTMSCDTKSVDALQLNRSERWVQAWVQEAWVREARAQSDNEDDNEQQAIQESFDDQNQTPNEDEQPPTLQEPLQNLNRIARTRRNQPTVDPNYVVDELHDSDEEIDLSDDGEDSDNAVQCGSDRPVQCGICEEWFPNVDALASHQDKDHY